jgi:hypothetical protein
MAPSATSEITVPVVSKVVETKPVAEKNDALQKTPLEAISHGPLIHPGEYICRSLDPFVVRCSSRSTMLAEGRRPGRGEGPVEKRGWKGGAKYLEIEDLLCS